MNKVFTSMVFAYLLMPGKYYIMRLSLAINITQQSIVRSVQIQLQLDH